MGFLSDLAQGKGLLGLVNPAGFLATAGGRLTGDLVEGLTGGGSKPTSEFKPSLDPRFDPYLFGSGGALDVAQNLFAGGGPQYYPGKTVVGANPLQTEGQNQLLSFARTQIPAITNMGLGGARDLLKGGMGTQLQGSTSSTLQSLMSGQGNRFLDQATSGNDLLRQGTSINDYLKAAASGNSMLFDAASGNPMLMEAGSGNLSPHYQDVLTGTFNDASRFYNNTIDDITGAFNTGIGYADDAALLSGNFGGSRGGVARGIVGAEAAKQTGRAQQALSENMSQATADVLNNQFALARQAQLDAGLGLMSTQLAGGLGLMDANLGVGNTLANNQLAGGLGLMDAQTRAGLGILDAQLGAANAGASLYNTDIQGKIAAMSALPGIGSLGLMGGQAISDIGAQRRSLAQQQLNADIDRFNFGQNAPGNALNSYINRIGSLGALGQGSYQPLPGAGAALSGMIGGGLAGAGTGFKIGQEKGALIGGGLGALGGLLG